MPGAGSRERLLQAKQLRSECLAIAGDIEQCLRYTDRVAWAIFLEYDRDLSTELDPEEVACMVADFFGIADRGFGDRMLNDMAESKAGDEEPITFAEFAEWFDRRRSGFGPAFDAQLRVRQITDSVRTIFGKSTFETKLDAKVNEASLEMASVGAVVQPDGWGALGDLERCREGLEKSLYEVKVWQNQKRQRQEEAEERLRLEKFAALEAAGKSAFSARERKVLRVIFDNLLEVESREGEEKQRLNVDTDLPKICGLLDYRLTFEENAVTKLCYEEDWDFGEFVRWWACRTKLAS
eukprot:TRINITY_DN4030_c4_g1_i1.p1 TRINITY_DN4030_c4_g1~~TRINITY_DN4030_c4_g1_i1.p1  ORF type:complete len:316 (+),score=125.80 TRINITY_DN4030_c4_g1_i1:66-950(+)